MAAFDKNFTKKKKMLKSATNTLFINDLHEKEE